MNKDRIEKIIDDLCRLEPSLKDSRQELRPVVEKLLAARPEAQPDSRLLADLRQQVLAALEKRGAAKRPRPSFVLKDFLAGLGRPAYAIGGAALALLIAVPLLKLGQQPTAGPYLSGDLAANQKSALTTGQISSVADQAFGSLAEAGGPVSGQPEAAAGLGGGGGRAPASVPVEGAAPNDTKMMIYRPVTFSFSYSGEIEAPDSQVEVLKFDTAVSRPSLAGWAGQLGLGLIDLSRLNQLKAQTVSLSEDHEYGYQISINYDEGTVSVYQNWEQWPQSYSCDADGVCQPPSRIQPSQLPDDAKVIESADAFLRQIGISTASYGQPVVDSRWQLQYAASDSPEDYWIPDVLTVTYPLIVNGKKVYDPSGSLFGPQVQYSVRYQRVIGVGPVSASDFLASKYPAQTDVSAIEKAVERGGLNRWLGPTDGDNVEYQLTSSEEAYQLTYRYRSGGRPDKLLVSALAFAVDHDSVSASRTEEVYYNDFVVVPLVKEFYDQADQLPQIEPRTVSPAIESLPVPPPVSDDE